ncbi:MAG: asparagine synthetase B [Candidatus Thorarchaeota archaeon]|jgi:asparagine synthase (glutamine-hydrolysing)
MAGIAGLLVTSEDTDSKLMLQKMSEAIRHRRCETYHAIKHNDALCMISGPSLFQGPEDDTFFIDFNEDLIFSEETQDIVSISGIFGVVAVIVDNSGASVLRTLDGTRALYYGTFENGIAFSSERKSLWSIGIKSARVLEPGQGVTYSWDGKLTMESFATLEKPSRKDASRKETLEVLQNALTKSFDRINRSTSCAVLFSGGVDSSLVALQMTNRCANTHLVTARSEGAHDTIAATRAASILGLPLITIELSPKTIWETLPEVIFSIETSRQMDVEIALPFYLASKKAAEIGCTTVVSGQGPDELFAGYARHVRTFLEKGPEVLAEQLWSEVSVTHDVNIERDERAIAAHGVESFFPYLDQEFVHASLSVPVEWKVSPDGSPQRKVIFRELAQLMGVPEEITSVPKSATQYSSGSAKALLQSIIEYVNEFSGLSKKKVSKQVQDVLDEIAYQIRMPTVQKRDRKLRLDLESVNRFLEKLEGSSTSNTW